LVVVEAETKKLGRNNASNDIANLSKGIVGRRSRSRTTALRRRRAWEEDIATADRGALIVEGESDEPTSATV